jgi:methionine synthase II (cobalamin-independent)
LDNDYVPDPRVPSNASPFPPPFRAEHIGSLKRPSAIIEARNAVDAGTLSKSELQKIEDREILRIVKLQRDLGYKSVTDGEYRRHMFYDGFFDNLEGMTYFSAHPDPVIFMDCTSFHGGVGNGRCAGYCGV